jgi:hypothetical protein
MGRPPRDAVSCRAADLWYQSAGCHRHRDDPRLPALDQRRRHDDHFQPADYPQRPDYVFDHRRKTIC